MKAIVYSAVLVAAILAAPGSGHAQEYYMGLYVGYNLVTDGDQDFPPALSTSHESKSSFAVSYGYQDLNGFRIEGELGWRDNDLDQVAGADVAGSLTTLNLMVNVIYEADLSGRGRGRYGMRSRTPVRPYIGIGGGGGMFKLDYVNALGAAAVVDDQAYAFAWQGIAGLGIQISDTAVVTVDYRIFVAENIKMTNAAAAPFEIDSVQSTIMLGLRTHF